MNKFKHLVKHGLKKRIKTKAFLISNIIIGIVILGITLIPTIITQFSGDELPKQVVTNLVLVNNRSNSDIDINLENMINSYNTSAEIVVFNYTALDNLDIEAFYNEENDYHTAIIISEVDDVYVLTIENKRLDSSVQSYLPAILPELYRYQFLIDHDEYENQISNTLIEFKKDPSLG